MNDDIHFRHHDQRISGAMVAYIQYNSTGHVNKLTLSNPACYYSLTFYIFGGPAGDDEESTVGVTVGQPETFDQSLLPLPDMIELPVARAMKLLADAENGHLTRLPDYADKHAG